MRRRRIALGATAALSSVLLATACASSGGSSDASSSSGGVVNVLVSAALSASGAEGANAMLTVQSTKAAADLLNKDGGINGEKVVVTVVDDQGDATTAITKLENAINSGNKPLIYIDGGPSTTVSAVLPILTQNKILSFNPTSTSDSFEASKFPYNFDLNETFQNDGQALCSYAKSQGYTRLADLYGEDPFMTGENTAITAACAADGVTVVGTEGFPDTALNLTAELQKLQSDKPDVLAFSAYGPTVGYALDNLATLGWSVPVLGTIAVKGTSLVEEPPPAGLLGTSKEAHLKIFAFKSEVQSSDESAALTEMISQLRALGPIPASLELAWDYDALLMVAAAAKATHTTTNVAELAQSLASGGGDSAQTGVFSRYGFTSSDHVNNQPASSFTFITPSALVNGQFTS